MKQPDRFGSGVVINHKTTKFESNSQHTKAVSITCKSCYQSQNYKIWKQFTTWSQTQWEGGKLLSITKLQNLKAIHNPAPQNMLNAYVVINHKTTKFESNSQLTHPVNGYCYCCYQSQNYKIWKQFITGNADEWTLLLLLSITKLQNLKAIHNLRASPRYLQ